MKFVLGAWNEGDFSEAEEHIAPDIDVDGTAFLMLSGSKITEVRTVFDTLALAVQTGAVEAPAGWPGRS